MRANIARRDNWAQIRIGACALLLPPLTLGAAFYSMLATPDEGAAPPPVAAVKAQGSRTELPRDAAQARAASGPQPVAQAPQSIAVAGKPALGSRASGLAAGARQQSAEETARGVQPAPVQVAGAPPAGLQQPPQGQADGALKGALAPEPSWSAPAEVSTALLPRPLIAASKAPQTPTSQSATETPATQAPLSAVDPPAAEGPRTLPPAARKHARSGTAVRRNAQRRQHEFSLKDWLQQIGILRTTQVGDADRGGPPSSRK
jgi:hypothetical protein